MTRMQCAHRRDETDFADERELADRAHELHVASASVAPASVS